MKKKIGLFILLIVFGTLIWYLFIKPYDYLAIVKAKAIPGTINQSIKSWVNSVDINAITNHEDINNLEQRISFNDSLFSYRWKIIPLTDSTSNIKVFVKSINNSFNNRITTPFNNTDFEKRTKKTILGFTEKLYDHIKKFKVKIIGKDTFAGTYCAYISIKSTQLQKAKEMKQNYLLLSDFVGSNRIELNGTPIAEITKWDINTDSIHYNFCFPIIKSDSLPEHKLIKYKQLSIKPSLKAIYNGNYITSDRAWYSLLDYAKKSKIEIIPKPIEVYNNNPNMGGDELRWKTEVYMPIK